MRAGEADELNNVKLVSGDGRILKLPEIADLGDDTADLVVLLNSGKHGLFGGIDAAFGKLVYNLKPELCLVIIDGVIIILQGDQ